MTDRNNMTVSQRAAEYDVLASALRKIIWGYVLIHIHFNLGTLDVLPDWAGYWLLFSTLPVLSKYTSSASLLRPFGLTLIGWNLIQWILTLLGGVQLPQLITIIFGIVDIYFHFQLLTNLAEIAVQTACGSPSSLRVLRTGKTVLTAVLYLPLPWEEMEVASVILLLLLVLLTVCIFVSLNRMKKDLRIAAARSISPDL